MLQLVNNLFQILKINKLTHLQGGPILNQVVSNKLTNLHLLGTCPFAPVVWQWGIVLYRVVDVGYVDDCISERTRHERVYLG